MKKIYSPWRSSYILGGTENSKSCDDNKCVFCEVFKDIENDETNFVLRKTKHTATVLNIYPYTAGHIMVLPLEHEANLSDLSVQIRAALMEELNLAVEVVKMALKPEALNVGINMGKESGGGIPSHLHIHVVPRWSGDINFMAVIFDTKPISFDLKDTYKKLKIEFDKA